MKAFCKVKEIEGNLLYHLCLKEKAIDCYNKVLSIWQNNDFQESQLIDLFFIKQRIDEFRREEEDRTENESSTCSKDAILQELAEEMNTLQEGRDKTDIDFVKMVWDEFPPKHGSYKKPETFSKESKALRRIYQKLSSIYHPDRINEQVSV